VKGEAKTCDVLIGRRVAINMPKTAGGADMGTFRVFKVVHQIDEAGRYVCIFEAIPADLKYIPTPKVSIPTPNPIECEVLSNEDPLGLGRVKVQFPFDERPCSTWIPVSTPDAGGNGMGLGPANRGFSFVPEQGDSVLVGFLNPQQLSRPYVAGSMYHGGNANLLGGGKGNHIKTITDKTSGQILFNTDKKGEWGITIQDQNGDIINLDTKGKNILITAPETIQLMAKNIQLSASENINFAAGEDLTSTAGKNVSTSSGNNMIDIVRNDYNMMATNITELAKENYQSEADNIKQTSVKDLTIQSTNGKVVKNAKSRIDNNSGSKSTFH